MSKPKKVDPILSAATALSAIAVGAKPGLILQALSKCIPVSAGLITTVRSGTSPVMTNHAIDLPKGLLEGWIGTPSKDLDSALRPVFRAKAGDFWRDADLRGGLEVVDALDGFGLGEGAGFKVYHRCLSDLRTEHVMMALLTPRKTQFPADTSVVLKALVRDVERAIMRASLPLIASRSIVGQLVEENEVGYLCIDSRGTIVEANRRAYELAVRYRPAGSTRHHLLQDFLQHVRTPLLAETPLVMIAADGTAFLEVSQHFLAKESHVLHDDIFLFELHEIKLPAQLIKRPPHVSKALDKLTPREKEIALLLIKTGLSYKEIADALKISPHTVRTIVSNIYKKLGVHSRSELSTRLLAEAYP